MMHATSQHPSCRPHWPRLISTFAAGLVIGQQGTGISSDALVAMELARGKVTVNGETYYAVQVTQEGHVAKVYWSQLLWTSDDLSGLPVTLITSDREAALFCVATASP